MDYVTGRMTQRYCFAVDLKEDVAAIDSYKHWHRPGGPPAAVTRSLREAGIAELDIYLIGNRLFMVMDSEPDSPAASRSVDHSDALHVQAWETLMGELQQELPFPVTGSHTGKWRRMEHIYSLAAQP
jgi:L-rhamnose mutarotase